MKSEGFVYEGRVVSNKEESSQTTFDTTTSDDGSLSSDDGMNQCNARTNGFVPDISSEMHRIL